MCVLKYKYQIDFLRPQDICTLMSMRDLKNSETLSSLLSMLLPIIKVDYYRKNDFNP